MFNFNGKTFKTITAIAAQLNKKRLYRKDFDKYGITEVVDAVATIPEVVDVVTDTVVATTEIATDTAIIETATDTAVVEVTTDTVVVPTDAMTVYDYKLSLKKKTVEELVELVKGVGRKTWDHLTNEGIRRMRLIMELKEEYYPAVKAAAPSSPWKVKTTEELMEIAKKEDITWKDNNNEGIRRMRIIMALKAAGYTPADVA